MKKIQKILGIVIYPKAIAVSQLERSGDSTLVCGCAQYPLPEGITFENLATTGNDFKAFLKANHFNAQKAVVGIPAKQIMTTVVKISDVNNNDLRHGEIQLSLERQLNIDISELAFDYYSEPTAQDNRVLVAAILKKTITQIQQLLSSAKITPVQITNTSLGLDFQTGNGIHCHLIEYPESFELCLFDQNRLSDVQYISKESCTTLDAQTAQKITRMVNRMSWTTSMQTGAVQYCFWTHDRSGRSADKNSPALLGSLHHRYLQYTLDTPLCSYAAELASQFIAKGSLAVNYLDVHHEWGWRQMLDFEWFKKAKWGLVAGLVLIAVFLLGWQYDRSKIVTLQRKLDSMEQDVIAAREMIDHVSQARPWLQTDPDYLELLRELTLSFPENSDIWLTSLAMDESSNQVLTGRSTHEEAVLDLVESLQSNLRFEAVKILYIRKTGKETEMMTFAINLRCQEGT